MSPQTLVILRGGVATGKTTIAEKLRSEVENVAWVHVDKLKSSFPGYPQNESAELHEANLLLAEYFIEKGSSVVVDSVFKKVAWIDQYKELAGKHNLNFLVFELSVDPKVGVKRDRQRPGVVQGWREPIKGAHVKGSIEMILKNPYPNAIRVDTTDLTVEEVTESIIKTAGWEKRTLLAKLRDKIPGGLFQCL